MHVVMTKGVGNIRQVQWSFVWLLIVCVMIESRHQLPSTIFMMQAIDMNCDSMDVLLLHLRTFCVCMVRSCCNESKASRKS
jgi:hypothetical protein